MITAEQKEIFQHVCFGALFLDENTEGKSPEYIAEKMKTKNDPMAAWQMLHPNLKRMVQCWASTWNFPLDELLKEMGF